MALSQYIKEISIGIKTLIYPPACIACGTRLWDDKQFVCDFCLHELERLRAPLCERCGTPVEQPVDSCPSCSLVEIHYDKARSIFSFRDDKVRSLIHALKYHYVRSLEKPLGQLLYPGYELYYKKTPIDFILPVPLHKQRMREREFNQSALLARQLGMLANIECRENIVKREKRTSPQTNLKLKERQHNLAGAFKVNFPNDIKHKNILIIDDVFTTGVTVNELCSVLYKNGAGNLYVLTLARAIKDKP